VCDSCYGVSGLLQVDGVTLDCSSSDEMRALRNSAETNEETRQIEQHESDDQADENSNGDLDDILSDVDDINPSDEEEENENLSTPNVILAILTSRYIRFFKVFLTACYYYYCRFFNRLI